MKFRTILIIPILLSIACHSYAAGWEYLAKTYPLAGNDAGLSSAMNKLGAQNWELVSCATANARLVCIFKRPAP